MVSAILLHYVIDDLLPTRGTFGDPGSNPGTDNFFSFSFSMLFFFPHFLSSFFHMLYYINCFSTWYVRLLLVTYYILHITYYITYQVEKKTKSGNLM